MDFASIENFAHAASPVGAWVAGIAVGTMLVDGIALAIYAIRHGTSDVEHGKTVTVGRPMSPVWIKGFGTWRGRSRRRIVASQSNFVTFKSLADGTAMPSERLFVVGIQLFVTAFAVLWVGLGLWVLDSKPWVLLMSIVVLVWCFNVMKSAHDDQRKADEEFAAQKHSGDQDSSARPT
jgi:hypothetical protein